MMIKRNTAQRRHLPTSPFAPEPEPVIEEFAMDDRVTHDEFGLGRVVGAEEAAVTVDFGGRTVRIVSPFRKLTHL
jgi:hypothetical protein